MKALLLAMAAAFAFQAKAQTLKFVPGAQTLDGVNVAKGATATVDNQAVNLTTVAAGIRQAKVVWSNKDIYVGQLMVNDPSILVKTPADLLASSDHIKVGAITMSFVYWYVPESSIYSAYQDAFRANNIDPTKDITLLDQTNHTGFLDIVNQAGSAGTNQTVTLLMVREANGTETLTYDNGNGYVGHVAGGPGFLHKIYSIWLGVPADQYIAALKTQWMNWKATP